MSGQPDGDGLRRRDLLQGAAAHVTGRQTPGGHSLQESHPAETVAELRAFLRA